MICFEEIDSLASWNSISVPCVLKALRRLVLDEGEARSLFLQSNSAIDHGPLGFILFLLCSLLLLFLLRSNSQFFELLTINFHVGSDDLVSDRGNCLIPMLLLRAIQEAVDNDWIGSWHICFDQLLNHVGVKE